MFVCSASGFAGTATANGTNDTGAFTSCFNPATGLLDATCFQLLISDPTLPGTRFDPSDTLADVEIRERVPAGAVVGSVLLFTGEFGDNYYDNAGTRTYAGSTVDALVANGFKTYEVRWLDTAVNPGEGWLSGMHGLGPERATRGAREIIEWIKTNEAPATPLCATGNSFGGVQIAYAIAAHGAGPFLASAVYSAGPSVADIPSGCFLTTYNNGVLVPGAQRITPGFRVGALRSTIIDALMGWTDSTQNCGSDLSHPTPASIYNTPAAQAMALVSYGTAAAARTYNPATRQFFVEAELDFTGATVQGMKYYNAITGFKGLTIFSKWNQITPASTDYTVHSLYNTETGAALIQAVLLDPANCQ
jgi:hypothetical protein